MSTRLHLRRIMSNPHRGDTTQFSAEDIKRTIISLQCDKTFGRAENNDVVLFTDHENFGLTQPYISRQHAKFVYIQTGDVETYLVQDCSENGTYINDCRLGTEKREIKCGDTIKFGHRNGSQIAAGQYAAQPNAEFAFSVEMPNDEETHRMLEQIKNARIQVFASNPLSRDLGVRVQQEEADSTNGNPELDTMRESSSRQDGSPDVNHHHQPSTSRNSDRDRAPHEGKFTDVSFRSVTVFLYRSLTDVAFNRKFQSISNHLLRNYGPFPEKSVHTLLAMCMLEEGGTKQDIMNRINKMCLVLGSIDAVFEISHDLRSQLADALIAESDEIKKLEREMVQRDEERDNSDTMNFQQLANSGRSIVNNFQTSDSSAFRPPSNTSRTQTHDSGIPAPIPVHCFGATYADYLKALNLGVPATVQDAMERAPSRLHHAHPVSPMAFLPVIAGWPYLSPFSLNSYLDPLSRTMGFQKIPVKNVRPVNVREVPVITVRENVVAAPREVREPSSSVAPAESSSDVDEERHSSSYSSAPNSRQRTVSRDSEILDVVGDAESAAENQNITDNRAADESLPVAPVQIANELDSGGTQTPSPELQDQDDALKKTDVDTQKKIEAASNALRKTAIEEQAGPSSLSTFQTPVRSPLLSHTTTASGLPSVGIESEEKADEDNAGHEDEQISEEPMTTSEIQKETVVEESTEKADRKGELLETTKTSSDSAAKKSEVVNRRMRMKQLDDVSADSDSDGDDNGSVRRKTVRRSARKARAPPLKKTSKQDVTVEEKNDDVEEETDVSGGEQRGRLPRATKTLKRTASKVDGRSRAAKSPAPADDRDDGEPPQKRRGRKKAVVEESDKTEDVEPTPAKSKKESCGVKKKYCLCYKDEGKVSLQWVQCQDCSQWFHVFCLRLNNKSFGQEEQFSCCGNSVSKEAEDARLGVVHAEWSSNGRPNVKDRFIRKKKT